MSDGSTKARVLVVDDNAMLRNTLAATLTRAGFDVTMAEDATPAMELTDSFEIVVADYNMQTATGADVVRHFKCRFGNKVYCLILSGEDDEVISQRCRDAGADAVISKPAMPSVLRQCLASALSNIRAAA